MYACMYVQVPVYFVVTNKYVCVCSIVTFTPSLRFNTNGIIKKTDCLSHIGGGSQPCDLYVLESSPQPVISDFPTIWPIPASYTNGTATVSVSPKLTFTLSSSSSSDAAPSCPTLTAAFERYQGLTFPHVTSAADAEQELSNILSKDKKGSTTGAALSSVTVKVDDLDESHPQLETDETYTLTIPSDGSGATIEAKTIYGAMHGSSSILYMFLLQLISIYIFVTCLLVLF